MNLPEPFTFSQNNLQDYADCHYRFLLRHVHHLEWPAVESEPLLEQEARIDLGFQFHRLVQQYFCGIDIKILSESIEDPLLQEWWSTFLILDLQELPGAKFAEKMLSVPFKEHRLVAKYDLLVVGKSGQVLIYDWKTTTFQPKRQSLIQRMQSRVYPALLMLQRERISPIAVSSPEDIRMTYWFPAFPDTPVAFDYSRSQYEQDLLILGNMVDEIIAKEEVEFNKTDDERKCKFCRYRSLCERGVEAGTTPEDGTELPPENPFEFDFDAL